MLLGKISGRITTKGFGFDAEARVRKLDYVMVKDPEGRWVLACIDSVVRSGEGTRVHAQVVGYRDRRGFLKTPATPFAPETPVYAAEKDFILEVLNLEKKGLYIGLLEGYDIKLNLPVDRLIRKHVAVLAKTGTGKSYVAGVLLEEFAENDVPVVVIDPHGEYCTLRRANTKKSETKFFGRFDIEAKSYRGQVNLFGLASGKQIKLDSKLRAEEIIQMLPARISSGQKGVLYSAVRNLSGQDYTLRDIIDEVAATKSQAKWNLISMLESLADARVFSANPTRPSELVQKGRVSIVDLKDAKPEIQQIIVFKLVEELFNARKHGKIPEFLLVLEEAHTFCPERGFGEVASSKIIRTVASEGRKFGFGLAVISQRPARVDKNVLSQANTQIILKVTNPNDLKAITDSVEGIGPGTKEEIKDLPVGVAMVVGVTDQPLIVDIRVRRSEHGGEGIKIAEKEITEETKTLLFQPNISRREIENRFKGIKDVEFLNYPVWRIVSEYKSQNVNFHVDGITGEVLYQKGDKSIERSRGIKSVLELPPSSRVIVLYLTMRRLATVEKLSEDLKMPLSKVQDNIKDLMAREYVITDGYMLRNRFDFNIPVNPLDFQISKQALEGSVRGQSIDFMVTEEFAKKAAEMWNLKIKRIEPVYYPYWLVNHKGKRVLIDGLNTRLDMETTSIIEKLI
jgi:DNA helicase HerA-like ATPase